MTNIELIASHCTLSGVAPSHAEPQLSRHQFEERVEAASAAGFCGIGLTDLEVRAISARLGFAGMRKVLSQYGMTHLELEFLTDWFTTGDRRKHSDIVRDELLGAASELGARHIKVGGDLEEGQWMTNYLAAEFRALCDEAAEVGTLVALEVIPFSTISDLGTAAAVVSESEASNGGLVLDIWHIERGRIGVGEFADLAPGLVKYVEINDAPKDPIGSLWEDTLNNRMYCGEGDFDIPAFLRAVDAIGYDGPYGVEILSQELRQRPLLEVARRAASAALEQFSTVS